jgi:hypothetical protein
MHECSLVANRRTQPRKQKGACIFLLSSEGGGKADVAERNRTLQYGRMRSGDFRPKCAMNESRWLAKNTKRTPLNGVLVVT